jgi:hypothetical protein
MDKHPLIGKGLAVGIILLSIIASSNAVAGLQTSQAVEEDSSCSPSTSLYFNGLEIVKIRAYFDIVGFSFCMLVDFLVNNTGTSTINYIELNTSLQRMRTGEEWNYKYWTNEHTWSPSEKKWISGLCIIGQLWRFCIPGFYRLLVSVSTLDISHTYNKIFFMSMPFIYPKTVL